jgi:hypothetical protein
MEDSIFLYASFLLSYRFFNIVVLYTNLASKLKHFINNQNLQKISFGLDVNKMGVGNKKSITLLIGMLKFYTYYMDKKEGEFICLILE